MPEFTINDVARARRSAITRVSSLRKIRLRREFKTDVNSPLILGSENDNIFDANIRRIEDEYSQILTRIDNAKVIL